MSKTSLVQLLGSAESDLLELYLWVERQEGYLRADALLSLLEARCASLAQYPDRGHRLAELASFPQADRFLQILEGPYCVVYLVEPERGTIYAVLDGRRDLAELLERRLTD